MSDHNTDQQTPKSATGLFARFLADTQGGVMIITGVVSLFLLLLFFALSIDHGRNYMDHADLDAKVKNLSLHLSEDWAGFRQKEATAKALAELGLTWERSDDDVAIAKKSSILWELPEPFGPLDETRAKQLVSQRMLDLIRNHPGLERTSLVEIAEDCNAQNRMLLRFAAKIPMSEQFVTPDDRADTVCTNTINPLEPQREDGCTLVTHTVALGIGCELNDIPGSEPPNGSGDGKFCPSPDGNFPHRILDLSAIQNTLSEGGKVLSIVKSLDVNSKKHMPDANDVLEIVRRTAIALDIPGDDIAAGAVIGNRPVASGDGSVACVGTSDLGWSGGCYDTSAGFNGADYTGARTFSAHRKHSFVGTFLAQMVRSCGAEPTWTYDIKRAGQCWEEEDDEECYADGWDADSCCIDAFEDDDDYAGVVLDGTDDGSIDSDNECGEDDDEWNRDGTCDDDDKVTEHSCVLKDPKPVYQGQWYAACPRTAMTQAAMYKDPKDLVKFEAHYSRKLDTGDPKHDLGFPVVESTISLYTDNFPGQTNQSNELATLKKYNTDRSWMWACETEFSPDGRMGRPYGRLAGRPLVTPAGADVAQKGSASGCYIPAAPNDGLAEYLVEYNLPGCSDPYQTGCDLTEGFYRKEIDVSGLLPARGPLIMIDAMLPDGLKNTSWEYQGREDDGGWAYQAVATVPSDADLSGDDMDECPNNGDDRGDRDYKTSYREKGANEEHARYVLDVPDVDGIVVPEIPEERLNIASYLSERRRIKGEPYLCLFDRGDDNLTGTKENFVEGPVESGKKTPDAYPWFADASSGGRRLEHPFWKLENRGILAFNGDNAGKYILGVEEVSGFPTHEDFTGDTDVNYDAGGYTDGTRNLMQLQALDVVRWKHSDYPPANSPIKAGDGIYSALALTSVPYDNLDIHDGHDANQCAIMKAGANALMTSHYGSNAAPGDRVLVYVGMCPNEDWSDTQYNGLDVNWHAGSNNVGALGGKGLQLQALQTPSRGLNLRASTGQCFQQVGREIGNIFVITSGVECEEFAQRASRSANTDVCPLPYCVLGVDSKGDCVNRLFSCIRKRATGGS